MRLGEDVEKLEEDDRDDWLGARKVVDVSAAAV